jgi:hypothetical protein
LAFSKRQRPYHTLVVGPDSDLEFAFERPVRRQRKTVIVQQPLALNTILLHGRAGQPLYL